VTHQVVFRPQAVAEARDALQWYDEQKSGLGAKFADAIDETIRRIAANPPAFPFVHGEIRRAVIRQFPYGIYFRLYGDGDAVVVLAVMHGQRNPGRWRTRR
jgi:toxin ParE1/3/4